MKLINTQILHMDLSVKKNITNLPINIYALKVLNVDDDDIFEIAINHNGYCPNISTDYDESKFSEYLCALEYSLINNYFKLNGIKKPKEYYSVCEVMTNEKGELYRYSKTNY